MRRIVCPLGQVGLVGVPAGFGGHPQAAGVQVEGLVGSHHPFLELPRRIRVLGFLEDDVDAADVELGRFLLDGQSADTKRPYDSAISEGRLRLIIMQQRKIANRENAL